MAQLIKPKRTDMQSREDYLQAMQVWALATLAMKHGATVEEVRATLDDWHGGFSTWAFLFPKADG